MADFRCRGNGNDDSRIYNDTTLLPREEIMNICFFLPPPIYRRRRLMTVVDKRIHTSMSYLLAN